MAARCQSGFIPPFFPGGDQWESAGPLIDSGAGAALCARRGRRFGAKSAMFGCSRGGGGGRGPKCCVTVAVESPGEGGREADATRSHPCPASPGEGVVGGVERRGREGREASLSVEGEKGRGVPEGEPVGREGVRGSPGLGVRG